MELESKKNYFFRDRSVNSDKQFPLKSLSGNTW